MQMVGIVGEMKFKKEKSVVYETTKQSCCYDMVPIEESSLSEDEKKNLEEIFG